MARPFWIKTFERTVDSITRSSIRAGTRAIEQAARPLVEKRVKPPGPGDWIAGVAMAPAGVRNYYLFSPPGVRPGEKLPLLVMLHGCRQDAKSFAQGTRMNRIAARERFFVLYPEQDRRANPQACWNWYETSLGKAYGEVAILNAAIDQVCLLYRVDPERIAVAGLSAGASIGALLVTRHPQRFKALVMHSGIPPGAARSSASALGAMPGSLAPSALSTKSALPPLLVIHGGRDDVVSVNNAMAAAQVWADAAGARASAERRVRRGDRHEMTIIDFHLRGRIAATLCEIPELGHAWSGGSERFSYGDPKGPDASGMTWTFAAKQFARAAGAGSRVKVRTR